MVDQKGSPTNIDGSLNPDAMCVVHTTQYAPKINEDGSVEIQTTSDATDYELFRNTIHTTLNHKVAGHSSGNWDGARYTIVGDFNEVMEENGVPASLNTVDTWWTRAPDETLKIPNAMLVMPLEKDMGSLYYVNTETNRTHYKTQNFTADDMAKIARGVDPENSIVMKNLLRSLERVLRGDEFADRWEPAFPTNAERMSVVYAEMRQNRHGKQQEIDAILAGKNHDLAVEAAISGIGYEVQQGGMWSWNSDLDSTKAVDELAATIGSKRQTHKYTPHHKIQEGLRWLGVIADAIKNEEEIKPHLKGMYQQIKDGSYVEYHLSEPLSQVDEKTRTVAQLVLERYEPDLAKVREKEKKWVDEVSAEKAGIGSKQTALGRGNLTKPKPIQNWTDVV